MKASKKTKTINLDKPKGNKVVSEFSFLDLSSILDNSVGGVVKLPLSIPITYDDKGAVIPAYDHVFMTREGSEKPVTKYNVKEYLYGSDYVEKAINKVIKLYGSGMLNQTQVAFIRDLIL